MNALKSLGKEPRLMEARPGARCRQQPIPLELTDLLQGRVLPLLASRSLAKNSSNAKCLPFPQDDVPRGSSAHAAACETLNYDPAAELESATGRLSRAMPLLRQGERKDTFVPQLN